MIPNKLSIKDLENLMALSSDPGTAPVSSQEFKPIAEDLINRMQEISDELSSYIPDNVLHDRWKHVDAARKSLKISLRNLRKSIQT